MYDADMSLWSTVPWRLISIFACECTSWRRLLEKRRAPCPYPLHTVHACFQHGIRYGTHEQCKHVVLRQLHVLLCSWHLRTGFD